MGICKPMFHWPPVSEVEKRRLDFLALDRTPGIQAAKKYLEKAEESVNHIKANVILPIAIIFIIVASLALIAWGMR